MNLDKIYEYDDYRKFLADYFSIMKEKKKQFSFRYFASRAGFKSPNFCYYLINGTRNVSDKSLNKLIKGIGLKGKASNYFASMVRYTQSDSEEQKELEFNQMDRIRKSTSFYKLANSSYKYLEEWYYPVIRELIIKDTWTTFEDIAKQIVPSVSTKEVEKGIKILLDNGLIKSDEKGKYTQCDEALSTGDIPHHLIKNIKKQHVLNSIDVMNTLPKKERFIAGSTLMLTDESYSQSLEILEKAHADIMKLAIQEEGDRVFQLNFQLYPNSIDIERKL